MHPVTLPGDQSIGDLPVQIFIPATGYANRAHHSRFREDDVSRNFLIIFPCSSVDSVAINTFIRGACSLQLGQRLAGFVNAEIIGFFTHRLGKIVPGGLFVPLLQVGHAEMIIEHRHVRRLFNHTR